MNPELWTKDYDWSFELDELKGKTILFFESLARSKRITYDPFKNTTQIRCVYNACRDRYKIPEGFIKSLGDRKIESSIMQLHGAHDHLFYEMNLSPQPINNLLLHRSKSGKQLIVCSICGQVAPFPIQPTINWEHHNCHKEVWSIKLGKPNTMVWKSSVWVLQMNFEFLLWRSLYFDFPNNQVSFDVKNNCWLIVDNRADEVAKLCDKSIENFKKFPKPRIAQSQTGGRAVSVGRKAMAAGEILELLPPEALKKLYRFMCSELHPDRGGKTETFQTFQQLWDKWSKS